jgi:hypothetical protein
MNLYYVEATSTSATTIAQLLALLSGATVQEDTTT